jgi:hypothetical protein
LSVPARTLSPGQAATVALSPVSSESRRLVPAHDHAIGSQPFARRHAHDHARRQVGGRQPVEHARLATTIAPGAA